MFPEKRKRNLLVYRIYGVGNVFNRLGDAEDFEIISFERVIKSGQSTTFLNLNVKNSPKKNSPDYEALQSGKSKPCYFSLTSRCRTKTSPRLRIVLPV